MVDFKSGWGDLFAFTDGTAARSVQAIRIPHLNKVGQWWFV